MVEELAELALKHIGHLILLDMEAIPFVWTILRVTVSLRLEECCSYSQATVVFGPEQMRMIHT
jgi:hypothetical protein